MRSAPLPFWRVYLYLFAGIQGLFALLFFFVLYQDACRDRPVGRLYEELFWKSVGTAFAMLPVAALAVYSRKRARRWHWLVDDSGVKICRDEVLIDSLPWTSLRVINDHKHRFILGSTRPEEKWKRWSLDAIPKADALAFREKFKSILSDSNNTDR